MKRFLWTSCLALLLPLALSAQFSGVNPTALFTRYNTSVNDPVMPALGGDTLGRLTFRARTGFNQYQTGAAILAYISGNVTPNSVPSSLLFRTGLTTATNRMILADNGRLGLGTMAPATSLHIPLEGYQIGFSNTGSDNFYVNSNTTTGVRGLRWYNGDFGSGNLLATLTNNGNFGIGTANPLEKLVVNGNTFIQGNQTVQDRLFVGTNYTPGPGLEDYQIFADGGILCTKVRILYKSNWPDYVFSNGYPRLDLKELEQYIITNKHLPDVPTAKEVAKNGIDSAEMIALLLKKVEELTLNAIEQQKEIDILKKALYEIKKE